MDRNVSRALIGLGVLWAVALAFDAAGNGLSRWLPHCAFHSLTGLECFGCGGQAAVMSLLSGDIVSAFGANPIVLVALPAIAYSLLRTSEIPGLNLPALRPPRRLLWAFVFATLVFGIGRNVL